VGVKVARIHAFRSEIDFALVRQAEKGYGEVLQDCVVGEFSLISILKEAEVADKRSDIPTEKLYRVKGQTPAPSSPDRED
jgi:hypothetical protein